MKHAIIFYLTTYITETMLTLQTDQFQMCSSSVTFLLVNLLLLQNSLWSFEIPYLLQVHVWEILLKGNFCSTFLNFTTLLWEGCSDFLRKQNTTSSWHKAQFYLVFTTNIQQKHEKGKYTILIISFYYGNPLLGGGGGVITPKLEISRVELNTQIRYILQTPLLHWWPTHLHNWW